MQSVARLLMALCVALVLMSCAPKAVADSPGPADHALILGPSGFPVPTDGMMNAFVTGYLSPLGFAGDYQAFWTPETTQLDSIATGKQLLYTEIVHRFQAGELDSGVLWVVGYSQSASIISMLMGDLADAGIPSQSLHFVLFGDPAAPGGIFPELLGWLDEVFPSALHDAVRSIVESTGYGQWVGLDGFDPLQTPTDLYPTDIFTIAGDGYADWNDGANILGLFIQHNMYPGLDIHAFAPDTRTGLTTIWRSGPVGDAVGTLWASLQAVS
ncbi:PE-PPE domain-containing protein [Mycolicibacter kumamotonensis]|nr:PE-PPE domain-containing protein [Mycolicibacter kumamotonensis]